MKKEFKEWKSVAQASKKKKCSHVSKEAGNVKCDVKQHIDKSFAENNPILLESIGEIIDKKFAACGMTPTPNKKRAKKVTGHQVSESTGTAPVNSSYITPVQPSNLRQPSSKRYATRGTK